MFKQTDSLYAFTFRGQLAEQAVLGTGLSTRAGMEDVNVGEFSKAVSIDLLDDDDVDTAREMAVVYVAITAFERAARRFVQRVLFEEFGDDWWARGVSEKIRKFAERRQAEEVKTRWHADRGGDPLDYTEMGQLPNIIQQNWELFEAHVPRLDWATALFGTVERSRNVIMHSGELSLEDAERVGINIRDWVRQVGT